ncbi:MAG: pilus assembly protein [Chloroflexi bacterium]|nr:pilus assembly protein [Chloroflexota bacterium]
MIKNLELRAVVARRLRDHASQAEKGQSLVEFALVLLLLLLLTFGMIDFCRAVYTTSVIQAAAQAGARAGLVSVSGVTAAVQGKLTGLDVSKAQITTVMLTSERIQVKVTYQFEFITPLIADLVTNGRLDLTSSASMLIN